MLQCLTNSKIISPIENYSHIISLLIWPEKCNFNIIFCHFLWSHFSCSIVFYSMIDLITTTHSHHLRSLLYNPLISYPVKKKTNGKTVKYFNNRTDPCPKGWSNEGWVPAEKGSHTEELVGQMVCPHYGRTVLLQEQIGEWKDQRYLFEMPSFENDGWVFV